MFSRKEQEINMFSDEEEVREFAASRFNLMIIKIISLNRNKNIFKKWHVRKEHQQ